MIEITVPWKHPSVIKDIPVVGKWPPQIGSCVTVVERRLNPFGKRKSWTGRIVDVHSCKDGFTYDIKILPE